MVDEAVARKGAERLQRRYKDAVTTSAQFARVSDALRLWQDKGWQLILFGGCLRDLYLRGKSDFPRDIDVVIGNRHNAELESELREVTRRRTSLGGFQVQQNKWNFDIWGIWDTWAYKCHPDSFSHVSDLSRTTFLNVEAIAVELEKDGSFGEIFENGFFTGMRQKRIDINWRENPNPPLTIIRTISIALKLRFTLSQELAIYITDNIRKFDISTLMSEQVRHYGAAPIRGDMLEKIYKDLSLQLDAGLTSLELVKARQKQMTFSDYWR